MLTLPLGPFEHLSKEAKDHSLRQTLATAPDPDKLYLFGYGSLIWRPCFQPASQQWAKLHGYQRRFSVWTVEARGTPEQPGLGLGLQQNDDADCSGLLLQLPQQTAAREQALQAIWEREMLTGIYRPCWLDVETAESTLTALAFIVDTKHPQYAADLSEIEQAKYIHSAVGVLGTCRDYLDSTVTALSEAGFDDLSLLQLRDKVRDFYLLG